MLKYNGQEVTPPQSEPGKTQARALVGPPPPVQVTEAQNVSVAAQPPTQAPQASGGERKSKRTYALLGPPPAVDASEVQNVVVVGATSSKPKKTGKQGARFGPPPANG